MGTCGFCQPEWAAAKQDARSLTIERAKLRGLIPCSDLSAATTAIRFEPHDQRLFRLLGEISSEEDAAGRGMLSVIVVHKGVDMQPALASLNWLRGWAATHRTLLGVGLQN
jgi:hypothetical protein